MNQLKSTNGELPHSTKNLAHTHAISIINSERAIGFDTHNPKTCTACQNFGQDFQNLVTANIITEEMYSC